VKDRAGQQIGGSADFDFAAARITPHPERHWRGYAARRSALSRKGRGGTSVRWRTVLRSQRLSKVPSRQQILAYGL